MMNSAIRLAMILACAGAEAAPLPDANAIREVLAIQESTAFAARFGTLLDGLDITQVAAFRAALVDGLKTSDWPKTNAVVALEWTDQTWARLDPQGLLEAAAARQHRYSEGAQMGALRHLLRQDRETAIAHYLKTPANESFGFHCQFYDALAALDAPRAARLFLESPDVDRTFPNPLEFAFQAWARQDLPAAWAAANHITRNNWRETARRCVLTEADKTGQRQALAPDEKPAPARPAPAPVPPPKPATVDDAALEQILAASYEAYGSRKSDPQGTQIARLFTRFPERSLEWLHQADPRSPSTDNRYRDLAAVWPKDRLPADTVRMLDSKRPLDRGFGTFLAGHWMQNDPQTAVPLLFSRYPALAPKLRRVLPFRELLFVNKQTPEQVRLLLGSITDPVARDLALRNLALYQIRGMPPAEALAAIVGLPHEEDRLAAAADFVEIGVGSQPDRRIFPLIAGLGAGHEIIRDHLLALMPGEILDTNDADRNAIPDILSAIRDPAAVMKAFDMAAQHNIPLILNERLIGVLANIPPGALRDRRIDELVSSLPPADAVALLQKSRDPFVRRNILRRLPMQQLAAAELEICLAVLESQPAAWRDAQTEGRLLVAKALHDPAAHWQEFASHYEANPTTTDSWVLLESRLEKEPQKLLEDLLKTRPNSPLRRWLARALVATHAGNFAAAFRQLRSLPDPAPDTTTAFIELWAAKDPAAAAAHCLLIGPDAHRLTALRAAVRAWAGRDATAAAAWVMRLPESPERGQGAHWLLEQPAKTPAALMDELRKLLPPGPPAPSADDEAVDPPGTEGTDLTEDGNREPTARAGFRRNRSAFRALADLDCTTAETSIRDLPEGELKTAAWFGLLEHATAAGKDALAADLTSKLLAASPDLKPDIAKAVIANTPLHQLARAVAYAKSLATPDEQRLATAAILKRWSAPACQPEITRWLQAEADPARRDELARLYLREILTRAATDPSAATPDFGRPIRQAIVADARTRLAAMMLDNRTPDPELIKQAALDAATARLLATWLDQHPPK